MRVVITLLAVWVAAGIAYLLFDYVRSSGEGSLVVLSEPPGAQILLDLKPTGALTDGVIPEVKRGRHSVTVRLQDHLAEPFTQVVDIRQGSIDTVRFVLTPVEGGLPEEQPAKVQFPERAHDVLPKELTLVSSYDSLRRQRHDSLPLITSPQSEPATPVQSEAAEETAPVEVAIKPMEEEPATGAIEIASSVPGATIIVNDRQLASLTPTTLTVPFGNYTVKVSMEGYSVDPSEQVVRVARVASTQLVHFTLKPAIRQEIKIETRPISGKIFVDSVLVGEGNAIVPHEYGIYNVVFGAVEGYVTPEPVRLSLTPSRPQPEVVGIYRKLLVASVEVTVEGSVTPRGDVAYSTGIHFDDSGYETSSQGPRIRQIPGSANYGWELAMGDANRNPTGGDYVEFRFTLPPDFGADSELNLRLHVFRSPRRYPLSLSGKSELVVTVNGRTFLDGFTPRYNTDLADDDHFEEWSLLKTLRPGENSIIIRSGTNNTVYHYLRKIEVR